MSDVAKMRRRLVAMLSGDPGGRRTTEAKGRTTEPRADKRAPRRRKRDTPKAETSEDQKHDVSSDSASTHAGDEGS